MSTLANKFGVNVAALAVVGAAVIVPVQAAATAAPVSQYANQWSQSVGSAFADLPAAPVFCIGTIQQCITPDATVLFSFDFATFVRAIPFVGPFIAAVISQFNFAGCLFGRCVQVGPYGTTA